MRPAERIWRISRDFAGILPRAHAAVADGNNWRPWSVRDLGQLGEVALDELALTAMTLTAPPPKVMRSPESCAAAGAELAALGVAGANAEPPPLDVLSLRRRRFAGRHYEQVRFHHEPVLPAALTAAGFGGPATGVVNLCRDAVGERPWLVWVHGAGQGQPIDLLFSRAHHIRDRLGVNVALTVQPGCGVRRGAWPDYPNMDPLANVAGMLRAVSEVRAVVRWLRPQAAAIAVAGVSMGSPVAGLVSHLEPVDAVAVYTPIAGLNAMIAAHLGRWGPSVRDTIALLASEPIRQAMAAVDYLSVEPSAPPHRRLIVGAWHDQMARRDTAVMLHERWGGRLHWHPGSHVGHLFAGGVHAATEQLLGEVRAPANRNHG